MKEKAYQYILYGVIGSALILSGFLILSDNLAPFTTQATLHKSISNIAPQVSGAVTQVNIKNGQYVTQGQVLFSIDSQPYQLAVKQAAAELDKAKENYAAKNQLLQIAYQTLSQKKAEYNNSQTRLMRVQALQKNALVSKQELDDALMKAQLAESAISAAKADVKRIKAEQAINDEPASIELAQAKLEAAKLDLIRTQVTAPISGTISNLQLEQGTYVSKGNPVLFLVNETNNWLSADFNEKGISYLGSNASVWISFDAIPGKLFTGKIISQDRALFDAANPANKLASVTNDSRWIREQQKIRVRIQVEGLDTTLFSGSRASVMVKNGNLLIDNLSHIWIKLIAMFRYLY